MTKVYSYSKLNTFEQCPLKFKLKYIEKIPPEIEKTIEIHVGDVIHKTLEWLYRQIKNDKRPRIDDLIAYYTKKWEESFNENIRFIKEGLTKIDYFNKGVEFLVNYYIKHKPFDDNTLAVEKKIMINLDKMGEYKIQGLIDRLSYNLKTQEFEIHDYKTSDNAPNENRLKDNKQLALYALGIKELFGADKKVCLIWHYLAYDKKIQLRKTNEELARLRKEVLELAREIGTTKEFPRRISRLCEWCEYGRTCKLLQLKIK